MANFKPRVSVIIPAYNEEKNIGRLLKSIKNQTYKNIEAIVVDDQSLDKTVKIAQQYTSKVFRQRHAERSRQRNFGAQKSKGDYLLFLDADMELTPRVIEDCIEKLSRSGYKVLVIPEKTTGKGFIASIRRFEREMYMGEMQYEVARLFDRKTFFDFGGYDLKLTGPEDYDLPFRISKKYPIGRSKEYILHHERGLTLKKLLKKKYYYAKSGYYYSQKHPELVFAQGTILFRRVYLKNWKKFLANPATGVAFIFVRFLETVWAFAGFLSGAGVRGFISTFWRALKHG